ncbi:MAG: hypothetical protein ACLGHN_01600 [Bacteriovoracia bacterium]
MDQKNYAEVDAKNLRWGSLHLIVFVLLIIAGIVAKRGYGHPEYMMLFHGPAAIFLIVGGLKITAKQRRRFGEIKLD